MNGVARHGPRYRFADFVLEPRERFQASGQPLTLTPKVFGTLVLRVERAGHVVSKDERMAAPWPRGFVSESNLTRHIRAIRAVFPRRAVLSVGATNQNRDAVRARLARGATIGAGRWRS